MNTKPSSKRVSTKHLEVKPTRGGLRQRGTGPLATLQDALEESADRELALVLENYDLRRRLNDALDCCSAFFHVAGKRATESWRQFEKAATMYQRLLDQERHLPEDKGTESL